MNYQPTLSTSYGPNVLHHPHRAPHPGSIRTRWPMRRNSTVRPIYTCQKVGGS